MKKLSKMLSVVLSLAMCAGMVAPAFAASFEDLQGVVDSKTAYTYEKDGETVTGIGYDAATDTVKLYEKVEYKNGDSETITISNTVTIDLNGNNIDGDSKVHSVITVAGGNLTIQDTSKDANGAITGGNGELPKNTSGGGVYVAEGGTFTMSGGTISENSGWSQGGGVSVAAGGTFTMNGGTISGNSSGSEGGGVVNDGTFTMNGGTISNNTTAVSGGGVENHGTFTMSGGAISKNETTASYAGFGGGVRNGGTFTMSGGTISENTAKYFGGGVYNKIENTGDSAPAFTMSGGSITGNTAQQGGGVYVGDGRFEMKSGKLCNNDATHGDDVVAANSSSIKLPEAGSMNATLESDGKGITGWYYDYANAWGGDGPYAYAKYPTVDGTYDSAMYLKAAHDPYFNVTYKDGVGENDGAQLEQTEVENGSAIPGYSNQNPTREGYEFVGWLLTDGGEVDFENGVVDHDLILVAQWREAPDPTPVPVPTPVTGDSTVEIEDEDVPLAGLFTRADAIGYLWEQTGSPEWELSDFEDVPENHRWAMAIGWAQDMGIALPDEDGNFRPDDPVLRSVEDLEIDPEGELQEFLNRYAVYAGIELDEGELFIELAGDPDDIIMAEEAQVIFDDFFAKLELALAQAA